MSSHEQLQPRDGSFYPLGGKEPLVSKLHCITGHHEEMAADFSFWWPCSAFRLTLWLEGYVERFLILALTVGQAKDCQKYSCWLLCQSCPKANAGRSHNKNPCSISARKKGKKDTNLQFYPTKPLVSTPSGQLLSLPLLRAVGRTELCGHVDFMTFPSRPDS